LPSPPPFPYTTLFRSSVLDHATACRLFVDAAHVSLQRLVFPLDHGCPGRCECMSALRAGRGYLLPNSGREGYSLLCSPHCPQPRSEEHTSELQSRENL